MSVLRSHTSSEAWRARAQRVIPGGTQTLSKAPDQWAGGLPHFLLRAKGGHVWDVDGHEWVDFPMALGPVLLGHAEPAVEEAITRQLRDGISYTLAHPLEVEVAERIASLCPGVEAVRFAKTGSDATTAAVRVSRAYTGRDRVLVCGYHGWHDWYAASTPRDKGIPPSTAGLVKKFVFNDPAGLAALVAARDVAAVVLEPSGIELPEPGFLAQVVEVCRRYGTVSVFDEMITGFRIAPGGVREKYGVCPDLSCYGKALGNGMPISVIAGTWEVMREFENVLFSGTYGGETLSLAAARAVLDAITSTDALARIEQTGRALQSGMRATIGRYGIADRVTVGGEPSRPVVAFGRDGAATKSWVQQCLAERGVLFDGTFNVCARHSPDDVRVALDAFDHACAAITEHPDMSRRLRSRPVAPGLRET